AVHDQIAAETLTRVLYPDDSIDRGRALRFAQEYFLVACSLADIMARFRRRDNERTLAYTNHTLLPEALEKWPVHFFEVGLPRHLEIIYEINRRFLDDVRTRFPADEARVVRTSLIEETPMKQVRMAHLAIVGSHSTNGVAEIHSRLLRTTVVQDF